MAKNIRWSPDDLKKIGRVQNADGVFVPVKSLTNYGKVEKLPPLSDIKDKIHAKLDGIPMYNTAPASSGCTTILISYEVDRRDMEVVATEYLTAQGLKTTKKAIAATIKVIRAQEAEDMLMRLNPLKQFYIATEVRSTKNHKQILKRKDGTRFVGKAFATMRQEKVTESAYKALAERFTEAIKDKPYPLFLKFTFIMSTDASFDFQNLAQGPLDQMQKFGCIRNDNRHHVVPIYNPLVYIHPEKSGVVITIL